MSRKEFGTIYLAVEAVRSREHVDRNQQCSYENTRCPKFATSFVSGSPSKCCSFWRDLPAQTAGVFPA